MSKRKTNRIRLIFRRILYAIRGILLKIAKYVLYVIGLLAVLVIVCLVAIYADIFPDWVGLNGKTVWDLAELMVVPFTLTIGGVLIGRLLDKNQKKMAREAQLQNILESYYDRMSNLIIEKKLQDDENASNGVKNMARAFTSTALNQLNGRRQDQIIQFLYNCNLIIGDEPRIAIGAVSQSPITGGIFRGANMANVNLKGVKFISCDFRGARFDDSHLHGVIFIRCKMQNSVFRNTDCGESIWEKCQLKRASFEGSDLSLSEFIDLKIEKSQLEKARSRKLLKLPNGVRLL